MKSTILSLLLLTSSTTFAAELMPGMHIYHLHVSTNGNPNIIGKITNLVPAKPLTATNEITVPNNFPNTVKTTAEYSVAPTLTKEGYEKWTKSIKYADINGDGCYVQFGWNPVSGLADVAIMPTNNHFYSNCSTGTSSDGTDIIINNSPNPSH